MYRYLFADHLSLDAFLKGITNIIQMDTRNGLKWFKTRLGLLWWANLPLECSDAKFSKTVINFLSRYLRFPLYQHTILLKPWQFLNSLILMVLSLFNDLYIICILVLDFFFFVFHWQTLSVDKIFFHCVTIY